MPSTIRLAVLLLLGLAAIGVGGSRILHSNQAVQIRPNDLIVGQREGNDRLVFQTDVTAGASKIGKKVVHEQTFYALRDYVITEIRALDLADNGTGASVAVVDGGAGKESITLRFKSQSFRGIYFVVQVFARPKE